MKGKFVKASKRPSSAQDMIIYFARHHRVQFRTHIEKFVKEMAGHRIDNAEIQTLLKICASDMFWVLEKLDRGELIAAQRMLHRSLVETSIVIMHELRLRSGSKTFQQARRVEQLLSSRELDLIRCDSRLEKG